jgi:hypothetical protein
MPGVQDLEFGVYVQEFIKDGNQSVRVHIYDDGASSAAELDQVEAALCRVADAHPNRPTLKLERWNTTL